MRSRIISAPNRHASSSSPNGMTPRAIVAAMNDEAISNTHGPFVALMPLVFCSKLLTLGVADLAFRPVDFLAAKAFISAQHRARLMVGMRCDASDHRSQTATQANRTR